MALPEFTMRQLLEAGAHFGHQAHRWNPKMSEYIFGVRNNIHIIDLAQSVPMLHRALQAVSDTVAAGGRVLFVGTKRQAADSIAESARNSAQYFVNSRWLGGMLTNWKTIAGSIQRLRKLDEMLSSGAAQALTKKERLMLSREQEKLEKALGGIKDMGGTPDLLFIIDTNKEQLAIKEARRLGIPVVAIVDTNCDPDGITYPVPGNDDAGRAIQLYCDLVARAAIDGISRGASDMGFDHGADEAPVAEDLGVAEAPEAFADEVFEVLAAPRGAPDDLTKLHGVGPELEAKLNEGGVFHYWQIGALKDADVARLDAELKLNGRIQRDNWVSQARALVEAA
ncbi:30S ribosomal protein S2 [Camelimonas sp. ID_303_24]